MFRRIEEVPLRGFRCTDRPVGIADILFAGELTFGVCVIPVSYTHLDVYKRQPLRRSARQRGGYDVC